MSHKFVTRLFCYAILSAIEEDFRKYFIEENDKSVIEVPEDVISNAKKRRSNDVDRDDIDEDEIEGFIDYIDFADISKILDVNSRRMSNYGCVEKYGDVSMAIRNGIDARNRVCHSRPLEPEDFSYFMELAQICLELNMIDWRKTREAKSMVENDPRRALGLEIPKFWQETRGSIVNNLPIPDFDDTGFLGRQKDIRKVKSLIDSPIHHVISIIGEGGYGKTALALKVLYDIIDNDQRKFDMVIWLSLKNRSLNGGGVKEIYNQIETVSGVYKEIGGELGVPNADVKDIESMIDELSEYMESFRLLIALDNLETINTEELRPLLLKMKPGSKILITSRVGLMEMEIRHTIAALDKYSAVSLARKYAKFLNVPLVFKATDQNMEEFVSRLFHSPLLIKWFVSSVSEGVNPQKLIQNNSSSFKEAIAFCFENLYEKISETDRKILKILCVSNNPLTRAQLMYVCEEIGIERDDSDWSISTLSRSSMVKMEKHKSAGDQHESTIYSLTDIAYEYVSKQARPDFDLYNKVSSCLQRMAGLMETALRKRAKSRNSYHPDTIIANNKDEALASLHLRQALELNREGKYMDAVNKCEVAIDMAPRFLSAYRIIARISANLNKFQAEDYFRQAMQINSSDVLILYTYCLFLVRHSQDYEYAVKLARKACDINQESIYVRETLAYALMRNSEYEEAVEKYDKILEDMENVNERHKIVLIDRAAEANRRFAEDIDMHAQFKYLEKSISIIERGFLSGKSDNKLESRYWKVVGDMMKIAERDRSCEVFEIICKICMKNISYLDSSGFRKTYRSYDFYKIMSEKVDGGLFRKFKRAFPI